MTLTLAATTDCSVASAICAADGRALSSPVSAAVSGPGNAAATGAPAISGEARVGETRTATTDAVADADGRSGATFAFQWISNADGSDTDIAGASGSSLRRRRVRQLLGVAGVVREVRPHLDPSHPRPRRRARGVEPRPRTAEFRGCRRSTTLRDGAFTVTNGSVRSAERVVKGENRH